MKISDLELYGQFVRPELARVLEALKLDNVYHKASGDQLIYKKNEKDISVSDFLGGFGSTILGHNHPEIIKAVEECGKGLLPQHSQGSLKAKSAHLAEKLNTLVKTKLHEERDFVVTLANTGTEAVEVALKHCLLEWTEKKRKYVLKVKSGMIQTRIDGLAKKLLEDYCDKIENLSPVILSLEKSFHGKTSGAIAMTANSVYRKMYQASPVEVKFFSSDELNVLAEVVIGSDVEFKIFPEQTIAFSPVIGFIYEPIQGEGGIEEIPEAFLKEVSRKLKKRHIPLISDEIQSGLFRTGKFLCSEWFGLRPDYILLGKSLGGGVAKISATMIANNHYVEEFGWIHTSTFSEDDWSSSIALRALEIMEREEKAIVEKAELFEKRIRKEFLELQSKYPDVIRLVKGRGFFLGIEFNFGESSCLSDLLTGLYEHGHATYVFTSYLLHHHDLRVGVTLSAPEVIRLEPSAFISKASVAKLIKGFDDLCDVITKRENLRLTSHLWDQEFSLEQLRTVSDKKSPIVESQKSTDHHIGFLTHVVNPIQAQSLDLAFMHVEPKKLETFLKNYANHATPFRYFQKRIKGQNGKEVILNLYGIMQPSSFFESSLRNQDFKAVQIVQDAVDLAATQGMKYFGLGQFTSIVSENGLLLKSPHMPITTGNSLTAAMAILAIKNIAAEKKIDLKQAKIGVVGFTGNICNVLTQIIADDVTNLVLVHRKAFAENQKYQEAVDLLLSQSSLKKENLKFSHELIDLADCEIVIVGTNSSAEIILSEHIKEGAIVLDISIPSNVQSAVKKRKDVTYLQGGLAKLPFDQVVDHPWVPLKTGDCFACMAETIALGLHQIDKSYSMGRMNKPQVLDSLKLARETGIVLGGLRKY
ncbi:MAG: aminotransferase class III-fold pyridoxal phosphate-dependent enzyme [Bacteriovorax sp.]|jgi:acetylornithine/succinyldiaminopimelate/putrescine aminotransferase/predicted amino acid dehydrogenase